MPPVTNRRVVTKEMLCTPGDQVRLRGRNISATCRAPIVLFRAVRWNFPHEPLSTEIGFFACTPVRQLRDIALRCARRTFVLAGPAPSSHALLTSLANRRRE